MFRNNNKIQDSSIEKLLENIDSFNGSENIKKVLNKFVKNKILMADGIMLIWTHGKHVDVDGTNFSDCEAVWVLGKAKHQIYDNGLSFND